MLFGDDFVAGAKVAQRFAKRQMHINRQRRIARLVGALGQIVQISLFGKTGIEAVGGRVRGVARAERIEFAHQRFGQFNIGQGRSH